MKKNITKDIEYLLYDYFYLKKSKRPALEVRIPYSSKRADMIVIPNDNESIYRNKDISPIREFIVIEIKVSYSDFKSLNGHNFYGNQNYYAMTKELYDKILENKDEIPKHIGVILVDPLKNKVEIVKKSYKINHNYPIEYYLYLRANIETALASTVRRLLRDEYLKRRK